MVRAVILDLGNVLLFHDNALLFRNLAARAGREADAKRLGQALLDHPFWNAANRGELDGEAIRREVCHHFGVEIPPEEFAELWSSHFTANVAVFPAVESLAGRVKRALLSNTNVLHAEYFRPRLPMLERFDALVLSCAVGRVKPDPDFYREALRRLSVLPEEAVFFDDLPEYVEAARALGMSAFVFRDALCFERDLRSVGL